MKTEADLEDLVRGVVAQVVAGQAEAPSLRLPVHAQPRSATAPAPSNGAGVIHVSATGGNGLFSTVDDAVGAARMAQGKLAAISMGPEPMVRQLALIYRKDKALSKAALGFIEVTLKNATLDSVAKVPASGVRTEGNRKVAPGQR